MACLITVSTPSPGFVKLKAKFGQVGQGYVSQVDRVCMEKSSPVLSSQFNPD